MTDPRCIVLDELLVDGDLDDIFADLPEDLRDHLADCEACRSEWAALKLLRMRADEAPHFEADELTRHRITRAAVRALEREERAGRAPGRPELASRLLRVAAVVVLLTGAGLVARRVLSPTPSGSDTDGLSTAVVLLNSGGALPATASGDTVAVGSRISTGGGEVALRLAPGIRVHLSPDSAGRIERADDQAAVFFLERGQLHAEAAPERMSGELSVRTEAGRLEVTGTFLTVSAAGPLADLRVLHGTVRVHREAAGPLDVGGRRAASIDTGELRSLTDEEVDFDRSAERRLKLLGDHAAGEAALVLEVHTRPPGAEVWLDGALLGTTPVRAGVSPGPHAVKITFDGEVVHTGSLEASATGRRTIELDLAPDIEAAAPPPASSVEPTEPETVRQPTSKARPARRPPVRRPRREALPETPPAPVPTATELLTQAQSGRAEKRWGDAARAYRLLIRHHGTSTAGHAALVSLAELELEHLARPARALALCRRYRKTVPHGDLDREALLCTIRALRRTLRTTEEKRAIEELIERYPAAMEVPQLEQRLEELRSTR